MQNLRKTGGFFARATLIIALASMLAAIVQSQERTRAKSESQKNPMPIALYQAADFSDAAERELRRIKGSRYNNQRPEPISELPPGIEELPINSHWSWRLSALPASQSDAVVVGEVLSARAYLSNDLTGVYSEFKVRITETLKAADHLRLETGEPIVVVREGGSVQFPSGRIQTYAIAHRGLPSIGHRYVFFLKHNDDAQDFSILTGYQLRKGRAVPLDTLEEFLAYKGIDENNFLNAVRESIARPVQKEGRQNQ